MGRKRMRLRSRPTPRQLAELRAARPARPPDPRLVRHRREALEVELDNQELLRRRREADAFMADALTPVAPARAAAPPPLASPFVAFPVRRVVTATTLAVCVEAWDLAVWIPKSAISCSDPDSLLAGWSGSLEVFSWWARSVGLPPPQPAPASARRTFP